MSSSLGTLFLPFLPCPSALLVISVPQYVPFPRVSRGRSSCVSKLSRVLFASTGISLRELVHGMDDLTIVNSLPEVGKWLRKGPRSCGKSAAMTTAGVKDEHGAHKVPGALQIDQCDCMIGFGAVLHK